MHVKGLKFQFCCISLQTVQAPRCQFIWAKGRLAPVLKTIFHQCVISYTCSQSNSDEPSELDRPQVYDMKR